MSVLKQMHKKYDITAGEGTVNRLREAMQEVTLAGLYRGGFFDRAAFYGGTCLRIFYGLPRFSEGLNFSLLAPDGAFSLKPYITTVVDEFSALGLDVEISSKKKTVQTGIASTFLKNNTLFFDLSVHGERTLKIVIEIDTLPPSGFSTEEKHLLEPFPFSVRCFGLQDLFVGKMHALLFGNRKIRVKGRDWFDFEWYVRKEIPLDLAHFINRAFQSGHLKEAHLSELNFRQLLNNRIELFDVASARKDVSVFMKDAEVLKIWSRDYFRHLAEQMTVNCG
jgi:predicted nucleotidyltransferase component of viral defense system